MIETFLRNGRSASRRRISDSAQKPGQRGPVSVMPASTARYAAVEGDSGCSKPASRSSTARLIGTARRVTEAIATPDVNRRDLVTAISHTFNNNPIKYWDVEERI